MAQQLTDAQRAEIFKRQEEQIGQQLLSRMVETVKKRCFRSCITRPSNTLTKDEQKCLVNCTDRFFEARAVVMHTYSKILEAQTKRGDEEF